MPTQPGFSGGVETGELAQVVDGVDRPYHGAVQQADQRLLGVVAGALANGFAGRRQGSPADLAGLCRFQVIVSARKAAHGPCPVFELLLEAPCYRELDRCWRIGRDISRRIAGISSRTRIRDTRPAA